MGSQMNRMPQTSDMGHSLSVLEKLNYRDYLKAVYSDVSAQLRHIAELEK